MVQKKIFEVTEFVNATLVKFGLCTSPLDIHGMISVRFTDDARDDASLHVTEEGYSNLLYCNEALRELGRNPFWNQKDLVQYLVSVGLKCPSRDEAFTLEWEIEREEELLERKRASLAAMGGVK